MDIFKLIFVGFACIIVGVDGYCYKSVEATAKLCLNKSMTVTIRSGNLLKKDITSLTPDQMQELCRLFHKFEACIEKELLTCIENQGELKKILETFEQSFNYICHDGFDLLMKIKPCTQKPDFKRQMGQCSAEATYKFNEMQFKIQTQYMVKQKACRYLQESMDCMETTALTLCGEDAQEYYHELNLRAMAPTKEHLRCNENRSFSLVGLGIFVALILALIVLVIGRYLRKRQIQQEINERHENNILTTRMRPAHMINPVVNPGVGVNTSGPACQSHLLNEATNVPVYPCSYYYKEMDKNDYSTPPPSYEQVMAESRNQSSQQQQPKPL